MEQIIRIEMDDNTLAAIRVVVDAVDRMNRASVIFVHSPGKEIQRAFGIDITKTITIQSEGDN